MQSTETTRTRAVILTTQRTGSTFLAGCLESHPQIECAGEILIGAPDVPQPQYRGPFKGIVKLARFAYSGAWRPGNRMRAFYAGGTARVRMFKAMYNQLANPFALGYLRQQEDLRIVHLRRKNLLKVHVSTLLMPKRAHAQALMAVEPVWIHVNPAAAIASMRRARALYTHFELQFERHPRLQVAFEDLFDGQYLQVGTAARICDFLGVEQHPMKSRIVRLNPESLREMVTNYDELADAVSRTEFAEMLE